MLKRFVQALIGVQRSPRMDAYGHAAPTSALEGASFVLRRFDARLRKRERSGAMEGRTFIYLCITVLSIGLCIPPHSALTA